MSLKRNKLALMLLLAVGGSAIFSAYSSLDSHFWLSSLIILPFQIGVSLYLVYLVWSGQLKETAQLEKQQNPESSEKVTIER
jgi:hypothetical protein